MSNTAPAKQVCKPKKLPFVIMCILSAIVAVLNVLLCVLVPKYYTTINSFLYKGPDAKSISLVMALVTLSMAAPVPVPVTAAITLPWSRA